MDDVKKNKKLQYIIQTLVVIVFFVLELIIVRYHEHWRDEAQSFLIARDTTWRNLIFYTKYEGTPPLWVIVIKIFITLGGTYENFYILPIMFSTIGIMIFEFKLKIPIYLKLMFPFTYFIFYQYTIVARSYCLILPILMLIASIYDKRYNKPILYAILNFLLMNISLHTFVIAGSLYLLLIIDKFIERKECSNLLLIVILIELMLTFLITLPHSDCNFGTSPGTNMFHIVSEATVGGNDSIIEEIFISLLFFIVIYSIKNLKQICIFAILFIPVVIVLMNVHCATWHIGVVFITIIFYFLITKSINENVVIKISLICIFSVQIIYSIITVWYDINENYSAAKELAVWLKENNYEQYSIYRNRCRNYRCIGIF